MVRTKLMLRSLLRVGTALACALGLAATLTWWLLLRMPGVSYEGPRPDPSPQLVRQLEADVRALAGGIGSRSSYEQAALRAAATWIEQTLIAAGYEPERQVFEAQGEPCANIVVELPGTEEIVIVGAHYDTDLGSPGANDNASGVAATLALARAFRGLATSRTLRFVFFVNEEPPSFQTEEMGSLRYARRCAARGEDVVAMLSLETLGYYSSESGSQTYPAALLEHLYGDRGDFVAFVGDPDSRALVREALGEFRAHAAIPSRGAALPAHLPGVGWSDHWSFWRCGFPALMVTDTAPYRYPHYHEPSDTPEELDYVGLALAVEGLEPVVALLARCTRR